ncbi:MAG: hypothetical protein JOZ77_04085 [Candidatus Eremiobacteraeota bacterium]|nr:hypothetical protein [Candidatus Eremiobacteraeota bacterium]
MGISKQKIDAIYELREAAEEKALAAKSVDENPTPAKRDQLLKTQLALEEKTMAAISVCHECAQQHKDDAPHGA